jgi:NADH:ubiquinone oxidoreductase subunit 4 (subunit M)
MASFNEWILSLVVFIPLFAAIVVLFLPRDNERLIKLWSIAVSIIPLVLTIYLMVDYYTSHIPNGGGMQYEVNLSWIPQLNSFYHLGADGLSVPLLFLTALLSTLGLYYSSFTIKKRVKEFFFLFLLLEMGMMGVFVALDFVLFYVFWEIGLVPMYFLIGIWGQPKDRPRYAAIKFFIYTLVGSVAMLLAILAVYFQTDTFDIMEQPPAALRWRSGRRQPGLLGLHAGLHDQGAQLPLPHLAARRPHRRAHGRFGDPGRRAAEAGRLRYHPHRAAHAPRGLQLLGANHRRSWA